MLRSETSLVMNVGIDLVFAVASALQTVHSCASPLDFQGVQLASFWRAYMRWKQSIREMAASLAISGSMCFPRGVERRTLKFCLSGLQLWLALIAVTSMSNLGCVHHTSRRGCAKPSQIYINTTTKQHYDSPSINLENQESERNFKMSFIYTTLKLSP